MGPGWLKREMKPGGKRNQTERRGTGWGMKILSTVASLSTGSFQSSHKPAVISLIFKLKQSPTLDLNSPASSHSISLLHFAADVLERVPYTRGLKFPSSHSFPNPLEWGFSLLKLIWSRSPVTSILLQWSIPSSHFTRPIRSLRCGWSPPPAWYRFLLGF